MATGSLPSSLQMAALVPVIILHFFKWEHVAQCLCWHLKEALLDYICLKISSLITLSL